MGSVSRGDMEPTVLYGASWNLMQIEVSFGIPSSSFTACWKYQRRKFSTQIISEISNISESATINSTKSIASFVFYMVINSFMQYIFES